MRNWKLNEDQRRQAISLYLGGLSGRETAKKFGVTYIVIYDLLARSGIPRRGTGPRKLNEEQKRQAVDLYLGGWGCQRIGKKFGVTYHAIYNVLVSRGIPRRGPGGRSANAGSEPGEHQR